MLKLTHTAHGAHLSDEQRHVTHKLLRPGVGIGGPGWQLSEVTGPYSTMHIGIYPSLQAAQDAAEIHHAEKSS